MDKQILYNYIEEKAPVLTDLSDRIWEYAELSMLEFRSADAYCDLLEREGFFVERSLCGIPTAFSGSYGSGEPVIGILGEFDALSGLSQTAGATEYTPLEEGGCGQGCGHNLLGAASLGAAMAIKKAIDAGLLSGTVIFYGCPGEEGCAGKTFMARDGMFRDLDAALAWHPGYENKVLTGSNAACLQVEYSFTGLAAHAAGDPQHGRSALDAAELMNVGIQFLREHMEHTCSIHYAFSDAGGLSPNVVQPTARLVYMVRAATVRKAKALLKRVHNVARGAALMTDTTVTWRQIDGTANTLSNRVLERLFFENLQQAPCPVFSGEDRAFAAALMATYQASGAPIQEHITPYVPGNQFEPGSTDVGDVSWLTPTAQFHTACWPNFCPGHSWQAVSAGKTPLAHKGMIQAAKVLAGSCADLMEKPQLLKEAQAEFEVTAAEGYDCPIGVDVTFTAG